MFFGKKKREKASGSDGMIPGITPRSLVASLLCMLLAGIYTQYSMVIVAENNQSPEMILPVPAMAVLLLLVIVGGVLYRLFKARMLTHAELLCVVFSMFIAVPIMTQGFWHRFLGLTTSPLRNASFDYLDAYNENLWPHGPNVMDGVLTPDNVKAGEGRLTWEETEYEEGRRALLPRLSSTNAEAVSTFSLTIPVRPENGTAVEVANPHLMSVLARTADFEAESEFFVRLYLDDDPNSNQLITERRAEKKTYLHRTGFVRVGAYGMPLADGPCERLRFEFGLRGRGSVLFADPKLMSVQAIEGAFRGRKIIPQAEYDAMPPEARPPGVVVKPDNMWSLRGLGYIVEGYIPLREWARPALFWGAYVFLLCGAFFAVNVIMRKKWAESERYPLPLTRIPLAMMGTDDPDVARRGFSSVFQNPYMWAGFIVSLFWCMMKGWHAYNPRVPDLSINVPLGPYFLNPAWGGMFNGTTFTVNAFIVSIAVFFELNVLLSFVIGYWLSRAAWLVGHWTNLKVEVGFPWRDHQTIGAYLGYFLIVIILSWKYLWGVIKDAVRGTPKERGDVMSSRAAVLLLIGCHLGVLVWARMVGASGLSMMVYFCFLVILGFVASKFRAECGMAFGYFTPYNAMLFVSAAGGMAVFGAEGLLVALLLSGFLTVTVFYLVPGTQFEVIQLGKRLRIQPRSILYTCLLGVAGGLFIGGWVFLSNAYSYGGDNIRFQWAFNGLDWFLTQFRADLNVATTTWLREAEGPTVHVANWGQRTMVFGAVVAMILTLLRQYFSGFWFHPIGFVVGSTHVFDCANWGNLAVAWAIRLIVLKIGGATAVRHKLQPFFVGVFLAALITLLVFFAINSISVAKGASKIFTEIP
jgi:hypothetical protein